MPDPPTLLPSPTHLQALPGTISLTDTTLRTQGSGDMAALAAYARRRLAEFAASRPADGAATQVILELTPGATSSAGEAYTVRMAADTIHVAAGSPAGLFYGVQTLLQLAAPSAGAAVPRVEIDDEPLLAVRAVQLDLRSGCLMPTVAYLRETIAALASYKINAVVVEWEDKFPYPSHPEIVSPLALSPAQVHALLEVAAEHQVQVIPLLQTLGHVEYILKYPRYAALRERAGDISQFCPSEPGALALARALLADLLAAHPAARYVHLGGDEPWLLGSCPRCAAKAEERGLAAVYLDYIGVLCQDVLAAGKVPIVWGDVLIGQHALVGGAENWLAGERAALADFPRATHMMYWDYHGVQPSDFTHFEDYRRQGFAVWVAPTVRYGDIVPDYARHLPNIGAFLQAGIAQGAAGALITSWTWKNMPFEVTWHGLLCGAERAWAGGRLAQDDLDARAVRLYYGADLPDVSDALRLLSYDYWAAAYQDECGHPVWSSYLSRNPGHEYRLPRPETVRANAGRAQELLRGAQEKATQHQETLADWVVAARLLAHVAEKQILFERVEALPTRPTALLDRAGLARLRERIEALAEERRELEHAWGEALRRTNAPEEVERDNALRFAGERAHTAVALEQLRVFEAAEGRRIWR